MSDLNNSIKTLKIPLERVANSTLIIKLKVKRKIKIT